MLSLVIAAAICSITPGCGGGGSTGDNAASSTGTAPINQGGTITPSPVPVTLAPVAPVTQAEASRFLAMSTFGPTETDIARVAQIGPARWLDEQHALPASMHLPSLMTTSSPDSRSNRLAVWWDKSVNAPDQLRQRVAFALSEIFVVSDQQKQLAGNATAIAAYYDLLLRNAFGNYKTLVTEVTASPAMATYLSLRGNDKANPAAGTRADENYARELMQLFTVGLTQLNADGSEKVISGMTVPTYSQDDVENLARALTGWSWGNGQGFDLREGDWTVSMSPYSTHHDVGSKTIIGGYVIPAGGSPESDLVTAIDVLFNHANAGPFFAKGLIQRLVTSNPSPAYVARVSSVFADNGSGIRGDLWAVTKAVLLDPEARGGAQANPNFGKAREPLLTYTHLWRAFPSASIGGLYPFNTPEQVVAQAPLSSPTVFNFFRPDFAPEGAVKSAGLVAPELQINMEYTAIERSNDLYEAVYHRYAGTSSPIVKGVVIDLAKPLSLSGDAASMVDWLDLVLTGKTLPERVKDALITEVSTTPALLDGLPNLKRVQDAIFLIMTSPFYETIH